MGPRQSQRPVPCVNCNRVSRTLRDPSECSEESDTRARRARHAHGAAKKAETHRKPARPSPRPRPPTENTSQECAGSTPPLTLYNSYNPNLSTSVRTHDPRRPHINPRLPPTDDWPRGVRHVGYWRNESSCSRSSLSAELSKSRWGMLSDGMSVLASCASFGHRLPNCATSKGSRPGCFSRSLQQGAPQVLSH